MGISNTLEEPDTFEEAVSSKDKEKWIKAMQDEYDGLVKCGTWTTTELPPGKKAVGAKWTYKIKKDTEGNPTRYKARLVAKGFSQKEGIDYNETFAPVTRQTSVRVILAIAAAEDMEIHQLDVGL